MTLEWHYRRNNCKTCERAEDFLRKKNIKAATTVDARKVRLGPEEALKMARNANQIFATKGTKVMHVDLHKDKPSDDQLIALLIGPSGNLRAPTLLTGKTLLVGFDEESYSRVLS